MTTKKQKTAASTNAQSGGTTRIFDIARPGALAPEGATTRPVIVTNRVVMQDPMMAPSTDNKPASPSKVVIQPLSEQKTADVPKIATPIAVSHDNDADGVVEPQEKALPAAAAPAQEASQPTVSVAVRPASTPATSAPESTRPTDSKTPIDGLDPDKEAAQLAADAKAQDEIDTLVEEKTYFLPINAVVQRRSRHVFIFGTILILVLAAAWLDIAMDAGFVTIPGLQPLTHLFSN